MSKLAKKLAATVPFAHLLGIRAESDDTTKDDEQKKKDEAQRAEWKAKAEDDPERKQKEDESDDDYAKRMEEMDKEEEKAKSEKAKDDEASADEGSEEAKAASRAERARCAKIIAHGIKNGCVNQAGVFAFDTNMSVAQAVAALSASKLDGGAQRPGLGQRMAGAQVPRVGADSSAGVDLSDPQAKAKAIADDIVATVKRARGEG